jgi:dienelactone hydrolase
MLATQGSEPYLVFVPDFIGSDRAARHDWFLPDADQKPLHALLAIITSKQMMTDIRATVVALRSDGKYGHLQRWAGVGFCWGSKGVSLIATQGDQSLLDVTAHMSPSRLDPEEAKTVTVPTLMLTSNEEDETLVERYCENLKGPKYLERFNEIHGWMSARYYQPLSCSPLEILAPSC